MSDTCAWLDHTFPGLNASFCHFSTKGTGDTPGWGIDLNELGAEDTIGTGKACGVQCLCHAPRTHHSQHAGA